mgnify:CR=1 FL=1
MRLNILYIEGVANLKERTGYFKKEAGEIRDFERDGAWVDVVETVGGGAVVTPVMDLTEFLDCVYARSIERAVELGEFNLVVNEKTGSVVFVRPDGIPMSFGEVMKVLFD